MHLIQYLDSSGARCVGVVQDGGATVADLPCWSTIYDLAFAAIRQGKSLCAMVDHIGRGSTYLFERLLRDGRVLLPLDHPDPAHCLVTGTGLTHLGSAQTRDAMHAKVAGDPEALTDSMKMFRWGLDGGKPVDDTQPVQPEWFFKGDGSWLVPPGGVLERPAFADDGGEESEVVGLYVIADDGTPFRLGFALGNEFSDHVMERKNYLYLAHSKLRTSSIGPELFVGDLPSAIEGRARIQREGVELWSGAFHTGETNMSYRIAGLEHHHFKYSRFRRPGDVHCHFFGTSLLSFSSGVIPQDGDVFEIAAPPFHQPLRNAVKHLRAPPSTTHVRTL